MFLYQVHHPARGNAPEGGILLDECIFRGRICSCLKPFTGTSMKTILASALFLLCLTLGVSRADLVTGIHVSSPLLLSGSVGIPLSGADPAGGMVPMIEAEAGVGGGRLLVGLDGTGRGAGVGVKAALMRTWLEPLDVEEDQLYLGAEFQASVSRLLGSVGTYVNIDGDDDTFLVTFSLGVRL
jgi:hypothetical protein